MDDFHFEGVDVKGEINLPVFISQWRNKIWILMNMYISVNNIINYVFIKYFNKKLPNLIILYVLN